MFDSGRPWDAWGGKAPLARMPEPEQGPGTPPAPAAVPVTRPSAVEQVAGWFAFAPLYDAYLERAKPGDIVVEIGVCYGKSIAYLAHGALARKLDITIYAVDPWGEWIDADHGGTTWPNPDAQAQSGGGPFGTFCDQMLRHARTELELIRPLRLRSLQAARIFDDRSLAMVMIDGSHAYSDVRDDIRAWGPKVARGGILAGDDYADDFAGVIRAVKECIGDGHYDVDGTTWRMKETSDVRI